jgi:hypothetical protein
MRVRESYWAPSERRGAALLETLVALLVLALAGGGLVARVNATLREEAALRTRERTAAAADRVLTATTLLTRAELDRRLGARQVGEFLVEVQRPTLTLYRIAVAEAAFPAVEILVTVVHRPDSTSGRIGG